MTRFRVRVPVAPTCGAIAQLAEHAFHQPCRRSFAVTFMGIENFIKDALVRAEKCSIVHETSLFNHIKTDWVGPGKDLRHSIENSWLNVFWKGNLLDIVLVTFTQRCYSARHHWIIAGDRRLGEEFLAAVCEWSSEVRDEVLVFRDGEWIKDKKLYEAIKAATFDNLILRDGLKREIQADFGQFFLSREIYKQYRIPWKRG